MALRKGSIAVNNRILTVCVRLFLEQGYRQTSVNQIVDEAGVSVSSFQNIFHSKDGVLIDLVRTMFDEQFRTARQLADTSMPPVMVYAVETAIQIVLTEENDRLRDIYIEAYTLPETVEYIHQHTARELYRIFGSYLPTYAESDFYEMEIGTAGLMRSYMAQPCSIHFPLRKKIERFLTLSMRAYCVPEAEQAQVLEYIRQADLLTAANDVMQQLFTALETKFSFKLSEKPSLV